MSYGVTSTGFVRKPLAQIVADVTAFLHGTFGANIDLSPDGPFGQLIADLAAPVDEAWQLAEAVYDSMDPDAADGARLVSLCAITGTTPKVPTKSTVTAVAVGTNGSAVPAGTQLQVAGSGPVFVTDAPRSIATLTSWASGTDYAVGDLRKNAGNVYYCITAGHSAGSGGPTTTSLDITDNTAHWAYIAVGSAAVSIPCSLVDFGAKAASAGSLTVIVTPVSGLASVSNPVAAVLGQEAETDAQLRRRREEELRAQGEGGVDSVRAVILEVSGVTDAYVFENSTDTTDGDGVPPHAIEAVVLGGADADVAAAVFTKGAGIQTYGGVTETVTDAQGFSHTVKFSRPTGALIYVLVNLTKNADYPSDGDDQVKQAIVDFATGTLSVLGSSGYKVGDDVVTTKLYAAIFDAVSGVADITKLWIRRDASPPLAATNIAIGSRELAEFEVSRVTVVST